jgi:ketosteroid isomerase-like protein
MLADKEAIRELTARYADCVWRRDPDAAVALFTADGVMDVGNGTVLSGHAQLTEGYRSMLTVDLQPFVHGHVIELADDRATGRCYLDLRGNVDGQNMTGAGHYEDTYVKTRFGWKFQSRKLVMRFWRAAE